MNGDYKASYHINSEYNLENDKMDLSEKQTYIINTIRVNTVNNEYFDKLLESELNEDSLKSVYELNLKNNKILESKLLLIFDKIYKLFANKKKKDLYQVSYDACLNIVNNLSEWIMPQLLNIITTNMVNTTRDPAKINGLKLIIYITENYPRQIKYNLIDLIPIVTYYLYNPKKKNIRIRKRNHDKNYSMQW